MKRYRGSINSDAIFIKYTMNFQFFFDFFVFAHNSNLVIKNSIVKKKKFKFINNTSRDGSYFSTSSE